MSVLNGSLRLISAPAQDYSLQEEDRSGAAWLVAKNYSIRFAATLSLPGEDIDLNGVYLCVENAMLPVADDEVQGYSHGIVSVYDANQIQVFAGPFLNPVVGMRWKNGQIVHYWTQVVGTWAGEKAFAGRLLKVNLEGAWQIIKGQNYLVEYGEAVLI